MARLLRVFLDTDMRCSHDGLTDIAKKNKINTDTLEPGEMLLFINSAKNRIKLYCTHQVVAYLKLKSGKVDMRTVALIPEAFQAKGHIDYDAALKKVLDKYLPLRDDHAG